ncbi:hypothetical protein, partial [Rhodovarius sp.]|uniref:hypothetical protein n=1 Tax=Rhodovarius sp. TaxID=2972673 RepID=UPI003342A2E0
NLDVMRVCFEPSAYNDPQGSRQNIVFQPPEAVQESLAALDEWALQQAAANSLQWFGKARSAESLAESYTPCSKKTDRYPASFRAKMNAAPPAAVRVWNKEREFCEMPSSLQGWFVAPRIVLRSVWFMPGGQFGLVLEVTDLLLFEHEATMRAQVACPF